MLAAMDCEHDRNSYFLGRKPLPPIVDLYENTLLAVENRNTFNCFLATFAF